MSGLVAAAMRKKVSYCFKIRIKDNGEIVNTDCECAAGKGPHGTCKHTACVLLMITAAKQSGQISIDRSCTSSLQTFHHPQRQYCGKF